MDHVKHVKQALQILRTHQLHAKPSKYSFFQHSVEYLGYIVSFKGVEPDPTKVKAIKEWKLPTTMKDIRSFLGLAGYYQRFMEDFSQGCSSFDGFDSQRRPLPLVFKGGGGLQRIAGTDDASSGTLVG